MNAERRTGFRQVSRWVATLALIVGYPVISHMAATSASPDFRNVLVAVAPLTVLAFTMAWRSSHPKALLQQALCHPKTRFQQRLSHLTGLCRQA